MAKRSVSMLCCTHTGFSSSNEGLMTNDLDIDQILSSIDQLRSKVDGSDQDLAFLKQLLQRPDFQSLMRLHESILTPEEETVSSSDNLSCLIAETVDAVQCQESILEIEELLNILHSTHFKGFVSAHDAVCDRDFQPRLPDIPYEVDEDDDITVKIIRVIKAAGEPLGATLQKNELTGDITIARVMHGGAADRCGLIHSGDTIKEVNGVRTVGMEPEEVAKLMAASSETVALTLVPKEDDQLSLKEDDKIRVRAQFTYDPSEDKLLPCQSVGLDFKKGDILEIVSQLDPWWWQAMKEGDTNRTARLIPSRKLVEKRALTNQETKDNKVTTPIKSSHLLNFKFGNKSNKKCKKQIPEIIEVREPEPEEHIPLSYEEVEKYFQKCGLCRPIVLLGPPGVGRNELKQRLLSTDPSFFRDTIPFTTRPKRENEVDGVEYIFMSRDEMEQDIQNNRFVEHGEYNGNLYGTSLEQIKSILEDGCACVLNPQPQALPRLRCRELKPFTIFVKPPTIEVLKETRADCSRTFTDEEFDEMLDGASRLESEYGHCFDHVIVNDKLDGAVQQLINIISLIRTNPTWVPSEWNR